jgi:hypothetical protein
MTASLQARHHDTRQQHVQKFCVKAISHLKS